MAILPLSCFFLVAPLQGQEGENENDEIETLESFEILSEDIEGYGTTSLTTATRMNTPLKDVSQTISMVTADFMDDIAAVNLFDAIAYMPAISPRQNIADGTKIRGLRTARSYQNNFRVPNYDSDMVNIRHIEVIKGPASAITGRGEPGGVVNYITKKPLKKEQTVYKLRTGSDRYLRGEIDKTGIISEKHGLYYRAIATAQDNNLWRDFEEETKLGFFPSVLWEINDRMSLLVEGELYESDVPNTFGAIHFTVSDPSTGRELRGNTPTAEQFRAAGIEPNTWQPESFQSSEPGDQRNTEVAVLTAFFDYKITDWINFRQSALINTTKLDGERARISNVFEIADQELVDSGAVPGAEVGDLIILINSLPII